MSDRSDELLQEMQGIFGDSFGDGAIGEQGPPKGRLAGARKPDRGKGKVKGKGGGGPPERRRGKGKGRRLPAGTDTRSAKKVARLAQAAARKNPENKEKQKRDKERFRDVMRDIHRDVEKTGKKKSAARAGSGGGGGGGGGGAGVGREKTRRKQDQKAGSGGGRSQHHPFKRSPNLGKGPGTPPGFKGKGPRHHDETRCWKCNCKGGIYSSGCDCTSTGNGKNCPEAGTKKHIKYKSDYKQAYNRHYHDWRARQGGKVTARLGGQKPTGSGS